MLLPIIAIFLFLSTSLCVVLFVLYIKKKKEFLLTQQEKALIESICMKANDALLVINIVNGKIIQANESAAKLFGYEIEKINRLTVNEIFPKHLISEWAKVIADVWEKEGLVFQNLPVVNSSNEQIEVECSGKVLPIGNEPTIVIYIRDIRERLKLERRLAKQKEEIEQKNKDITDSIQYARIIQHGILPSKEMLDSCFSDYFVLFHPKDIISGDFYWGLSSINRKTNSKLSIIAAVDCTGHGVPGACMSMLGNTLLNQTISNPKVVSSADVLNFLSETLPDNLKSNSSDFVIRDGMDMALCIFDFGEMKLNFSGANNPCWIIRNQSLIELNGDKQAISAMKENHHKDFTNHYFDLQKGDSIYIFTDGYADQFGGEKGKKFKYSQLRDYLLEINLESMEKQKVLLLDKFKTWKGNHEQTDDVCVAGIRV